MIFRSWNVGSMYGRSSLITVAKELSKYKLDLLGVQEIRRDRCGTKPAGGKYILPSKGE
jgi:hypothetical protein